MEKEIFKREEIKAGYLLCVEDQEDGRKFNMTVIPAKSPDMSPAGLMFATMVTGIKPLAPGDLACANPGKDWCPLSRFDDKLEGGSWQVNAVYGYTTVQHSMDNTIEDRRLLWRRYLPKLLTPAEIEKALGYPVVIIQEGENRKPIGFKKSSIQPGMVVERRDGAKRLVVSSEDGLVLYLPSCRIEERLDTYTDTDGVPNRSRVYANAEAADIVKVWSRPSAAADFAYVTTDTARRSLLWERDEAKRMTMKEIEKALGYPVVLVKPGEDTRTVYAVDEAGRAVASAKV